MPPKKLPAEGHRWAESKYVNRRRSAPAGRAGDDSQDRPAGPEPGQLLQGGRAELVACWSEFTFNVFTLIVVIVITCVVLNKNLNSRSPFKHLEISQSSSPTQGFPEG